MEGVHLYMGNQLSHYFIEDDSLPPDIQTFPYYFGAEKFMFTSDAGMFSPGHVDEASSLLLHTMPKRTGRFLDLGCGYGVIGIVMGKVYGLEVTMADSNGRALRCAQQNCEANQVKAQIIQSDCFQNISQSFDTIALNPPIHAGKAVMYAMYEGAYAHLNAGGRFYVVIQKKHGAESTVKKLTEIFHHCDTLYKKNSYRITYCLTNTTVSSSGILTKFVCSSCSTIAQGWRVINCSAKF